MAAKNSFAEYIDIIGTYFDKLPKLSNNAKRSIVSVIPWLALIFGILGIATALVGVGIFTILEPIAQVTGERDSGYRFIFVALSLVSSVLLLSAFSGAQRKKKIGWNRLYYSEAVALLSDVISVDFFGILLSLLGFFILYQIREFYTK